MRADVDHLPAVPPEPLPPCLICGDQPSRFRVRPKRFWRVVLFLAGQPQQITVCSVTCTRIAIDSVRTTARWRGAR